MPASTCRRNCSTCGSASPARTGRCAPAATNWTAASRRALLLNILVRGEEATRSLVLVEGWNFRQVRAALAKAEQLKPETVGRRPTRTSMARLGRPGVHPEGRFFPDTYTYSKGSTDVALLQRAMRAMDKKLDAAWAARASDLPLEDAR